jgi:hypothetical protein
LLPKTSELRNPPFLNENNLELNKRIFIALSYFIKKYEEAIRIGIEETVKLVEKILPFMVLKVKIIIFFLIILNFKY